MTMEIEEKIFEKAKPLWNQLIPYGFQKVGDGYRYEASSHQGDFQVHIEIHPNGEVTGKVTDTNFGDEYALFRVEGILDPSVGADGTGRGALRSLV